MHRIENNLGKSKQEIFRKIAVCLRVLHVRFHREDYWLVLIYQMKRYFSSRLNLSAANPDEHEHGLDNEDQPYPQQPNLN